MEEYSHEQTACSSEKREAPTVRHDSGEEQEQEVTKARRVVLSEKLQDSELSGMKRRT